MSLRRPPGLVVRIREGQALDVDALLAGTLVVEPTAQLVASVTGGDEHELGDEDVRALLDPNDDDATRRLVSLGLLVDGDGERDDWWHAEAAHFHFATRWRDVSQPASLEAAAFDETDARAGLALLRERLGPPPPHFHHRDESA